MRIHAIHITTRKYLDTAGLITKQYVKFPPGPKARHTWESDRSREKLSSKMRVIAFERYRAEVFPCWTLRLQIYFLIELKPYSVYTTEKGKAHMANSKRLICTKRVMCSRTWINYKVFRRISPQYLTTTYKGSTSDRIASGRFYFYRLVSSYITVYTENSSGFEHIS